jgi:hypothetical protein
VAGTQLLRTALNGSSVSPAFNKAITLFKEKINKENLRIKVGLITGDFYVYYSITEPFPSSFP